MQLFLIRHGQASFGKSNYDRLSPTGENQAGLLAGHLLANGIKFDRIVTGEHDRQKGTLAPYLKMLAAAGRELPPVTEDAAFNEYDIKGVLEAFTPMLLKERPDYEEDAKKMFSSNRAFMRVVERVMLDWAAGNYSAVGVATWAEFVKKVEEALGRIAQNGANGERVAVFTSGGPIGVMVGSLLDLPGESIMRVMWQIVNASLTRVKVDVGRMSLFSFNEHGYLEQNGQGDIITYR
jgi:broad specificity phosphatase PhoE